VEELAKLVSNGGTLGTASVIAIALVALATLIPKLLNSIKGDQLTTNVLDRIKELESKSNEQDVKIHKFAVKVTKLVVVVIKLEALLKENNIPIPPDLMHEMSELRKDPEVDK